MGNTKPRIFAAGGFSPAKSCVLDSMEYSVSSDKIWKSIKLTMCVPRLKPSIVVNVDKVYVIGGRDAEQSHLTVDIFDRTSQKWLKNKPKLKENKENSNSFLYEGKIFCVGGSDKTNIEVLKEENKTLLWQFAGTLKRSFVSFHCVVYEPL